eukprot:2236907-Rhodomonas_salina.2
MGRADHEPRLQGLRVTIRSPRPGSRRIRPGPCQWVPLSEPGRAVLHVSEPVSAPVSAALLGSGSRANLNLGLRARGPGRGSASASGTCPAAPCPGYVVVELELHASGLRSRRRKGPRRGGGDNARQSPSSTKSLEDCDRKARCWYTENPWQTHGLALRNQMQSRTAQVQSVWARWALGIDLTLTWSAAMASHVPASQCCT